MQEKMDYRIEHVKITEPVSNFRLRARESLKGQWGKVFSTGFLYLLMISVPLTIFNELFQSGNQSYTVDEIMEASQSASNISTSFIDLINPAVFLYNFLTTGAFTLGLTVVVLSFLRRQETNPGMIFSGFGNYLKSLGAYLYLVLIVFIWTMILMIPVSLLTILLGSFGGEAVSLILPLLVLIIVMAGLVIIMLRYIFAFYFIADNPRIKVVYAFGLSRYHMEGNKKKFILLNLSFIGWLFVANLAVYVVSAITTITIGIGNDDIPFYLNLIFDVINSAANAAVIIYMYTASAAFYDSAVKKVPIEE